jgi:hypothetical protein
MPLVHKGNGSGSKWIPTKAFLLHLLTPQKT